MEDLNVMTDGTSEKEHRWLRKVKMLQDSCKQQHKNRGKNRRREPQYIYYTSKLYNKSFASSCRHIR